MNDIKPAGEEPQKRPLWKVVVETAIVLLFAVLVAVLFQSFFVRAFAVTSSSMSPTIKEGDRVFVDKVTYYFRKPRRGDIILFRYPPSSPAALNTTNPLYWPFEQIGETLHLTHRLPSPPFVKRVIATGGETVELRKGRVFIDGKRIEENYDVPDSYDMPPRKIPAGQLFVMGDNRPNSNDSRYWGLVPERSVIGKVFLVWWPLSRFGGRGS
jgi:signal peptidase I